MIGIDDVSLKNKTVLVRVDYNISLDERHHIINDERIKQSLPTLELLLKNNKNLMVLKKNFHSSLFHLDFNNSSLP